MTEPKTTPLDHLSCIQLTLEDAQACLLGDTPEVGTYEDGRAATLEQVRAALLRHIPEIRKALAVQR